MWTLSAPNLPQTAADPDRQPTALCIIGGATQSPVVAQVDYLDKWRSSAVVMPWEPTTAIVDLPAAVNQAVTITAPSDLVHIEVIHANGQTFTEAKDPDSPQSGEFVYTTAIDSTYLESQPTITSVVLYGATGGGSASIVGGTRPAAIPTNVLSSAVLGDLRSSGLPFTGQLTWTLGLEQHPSGTLNLLCLADQASRYRDYFRVGHTFKLAGVGFAVTRYTEKYTKTGICQITVSLGGSWARSIYNRPVYLRKANQISAPNSTPGDIDPDCGIDTSDQPNSNQKSTVTLASLASQVGVSLSVDGSYWAIKLSSDTSSDATQNWISLLQEMSRPNQCCIDWSNYEYVAAMSIDSASTWRYTVNEFEATYEGETQNSSTYIGYAVDLKNVELTGNFTTTQTTTKRSNTKNQPPTWVARSPKMVTLTSGDADPTVPPDNVIVLKTLSLNFDASGPTKTTRISVTQDGQPFQVTEIIYGFLYTALEIFDEMANSLLGDPIAHWQVVSFKQQTYSYDGQYGYPIGYDTIGFKYARMAQESDDTRETIYFSPLSDETPSDAEVREKNLNLYRFQQIPIVEKNRIQHHSYAGYYSDASEDPNWVSYKHCNRDGTSDIRYVSDPTWAPPVFAKNELTYASAFAKLLNPEFDPYEDYSDKTRYTSQDPPPPKYKITGEESLRLRSLTIKSSGGSPYGDSVNYTPANGTDLYTERVYEGSAQNADFKDFVVRESFTENEGKPSPSSRLPAQLERKQEQEQSEGDTGQKTPTPKQYRYSICSPGYDPTMPYDGSVSYINATTPELTAIGADTNLKIQDIQESASFSVSIPFNADLKPPDFVAFKLTTGQSFSTRVVRVQHTLKLFYDAAAGETIVTWQPSQITTGPDRSIPTIFSKKLVSQQNATGAQNKNSNIVIIGSQEELSIGSLFDVSKLISRGNY